MTDFIQKRLFDINQEERNSGRQRDSRGEWQDLVAPYISSSNDADSFL